MAILMSLYSFIFTNMEREGEEENAWGEVQLNQRGRPKQVVVFYQLTEEMKQEALSELAKDMTQVEEQAYQKFMDEGDKVWDKFYKFHKCNFFKDRTYLEREMPEITHFKRLHQLNGTVSNYYELGCGVGNTLFPLLRQFDCFNYYGCDISAKAIDLINEEMEKHQDLKPRMKVTVCDLVKHQIPYQLTGDLNSLIFVLSAIAPERHTYVMQKVADSMKPGSFLFFRDYGRYDFGQLNLSSKGNRKLKDNFYRKNDGVCVYYFLEEELAQLATNAGLTIIKINFHCKLLQNRKTGLKMYRVWIQGRFYKAPLSPFFQDCLNEQLQKEAMEEKQSLLQEKQEGEVEGGLQKMEQQLNESVPKEQLKQVSSKMEGQIQKQELSDS